MPAPTGRQKMGHRVRAAREMSCTFDYSSDDVELGVNITTIPVGSLGTVKGIGRFGDVLVEWDNFPGSCKLALLSYIDWIK